MLGNLTQGYCTAVMLPEINPQIDAQGKVISPAKMPPTPNSKYDKDKEAIRETCLKVIIRQSALGANISDDDAKQNAQNNPGFKEALQGLQLIPTP